MKKMILIILLFLFTATINNAQRIKDIAYFKGVSQEQLVGYGLIVGLAGTGDSYRSTFTVQSVVSMLKRFGITVPQTNLRVRNVAAVMVTARITNLLEPGSQFDVLVSSLGDATSLMGGTLIRTPLRWQDGKYYALAQGPVSVGGYDFNTASGARISKNHTLSGRIPNGANLQLPIPRNDITSDELDVMLETPDFTTANNVASAINNKFGKGTANAINAAEIKIHKPSNQKNLTAFLASVESIQVKIDVVAKVVLDERTGTVVTGTNVRIAPVTISHGNLNITIRSYPIISQPNAFSNGTTTVFNNLVPNVKQQNRNTVALQGASNVQQVAAALNALKVSPRDIIAIFQALKAAGALTAKLIII